MLASISSSSNVKQCSVQYTDLAANKQHSANASLTINAAGPWVDELAGAVGAKRLIGGTKGRHLVVAPFQGAPQAALYVEAQLDQRPFFIIPWNGNYLIGTTDIRYEGDPGEAKIAGHESEYLLAETNRIIPEASLTRESILLTYSGVRPLAYAKNQKEESITRRHFIHDHSPRVEGLLSIVGGKLTTYRSLAEQAVNLVVGDAGARERVHPAQHTKPLPGRANVGRNFGLCQVPGEVQKGMRPGGVGGRTAAENLWHASNWGFAIGRGATGAARAVQRADRRYRRRVVFSFQYEVAQRLSDCLLRRTMDWIQFHCWGW
jgi:glycerol-3-phosphate dehydrogenase